MSDLRRRLDDDATIFADLAPLSPAVTKLIGTLTGEDADFFEAERIIRADPIIAARLLSAANTTVYAAYMPVTSIRGALFRLGTVAARRLVFLLGLHAVVPGSRIERTVFWRHSLAVAHVAEVIARLMPNWSRTANPDVAFLAALLHDLGLLIFIRHFPLENARVLSVAEQEHLPRWQIEREVLGTDHARLGARLAEHWVFPPMMGTAIRFHHEFAEAPDIARQIAAIIALADALCSEDAESTMGEGSHVNTVDEAAALLGLSADTLGRIVDETRVDSGRHLAVLEAMAA